MLEQTEIIRGDVAAVLSTEAGALVLDIRRQGRSVLRAVELGAGDDRLTEVRNIEQREISEQYTMHVGKRIGERRVAHTEVDVQVGTASGASGILRLRIADDGIAWRYRVAAGTEVRGERTRIVVPEGARSWMLQYTTWYEAERFGADLADLAAGDYGMPALIRTGEDYALITESDIDGRWSGAHLAWDGASFAVTPADEVVAIADDTWTPWRTVLLGELADVVASTLVEDLARAADPALENADWIRPGRAAWSWWSSQYSGADIELQLRWADYAGDRGWEHLLVDCGWDAAWVPELVERASRRGVQVHLWSKWQHLVGPDLAKLKLWQSWGVAGIKVDFMESEAQARHAWYADTMAAAADAGLMVNFHGSTIPRGWARSQPHVMTHEGIRGAEYYTFMGDPLKASHNVIQPFTRNVVGSMDYTPVTFTAPGRETSDAHELALAVVFESGITHFADAVESYADRPIAEHLLEEMPAVWDEVRLLDGDPDRFAVIARRRGERWFIGVIATGDPFSIDLDLSALADGGVLWRIDDAGDGGLRDEVLDAPDLVTVDLALHGGAVLVLAPTRDALRTAKPAPHADDLRATPALQVAGAGETVEVELRFAAAVGESPFVRVPVGWVAEPVAEQDDTARWSITAPADAAPGDVTVISLGVVGSGAPRFAHARIQIPVGDGITAVEKLPAIHARNGYGPIERDQSNGGGDPDDGQPMRVAGEMHANGLGVSAPSEVDFAVAGARRFTARFGVDDETPGATMRFEVWGDGNLLAEGQHAAGDQPVVIDAELDGVSILSLRTPGGAAGKDAPHGDWISPKLHR